MTELPDSAGARNPRITGRRRSGNFRLAVKHCRVFEKLDRRIRLFPNCLTSGAKIPRPGTPRGVSRSLRTFPKTCSSRCSAIEKYTVSLRQDSAESSHAREITAAFVAGAREILRVENLSFFSPMLNFLFLRFSMDFQVLAFFALRSATVRKFRLWEKILQIFPSKTTYFIVILQPF